MTAHSASKENTLHTRFLAPAALTILLLSGAAYAQQSPAAPANGPAPLVVYFAPGSAAVRHQDEAVLDRASRAFNEGHPIVMVISGASDTVGPAARNLVLSQQRTNAVLRGLVARGIPVGHFQLLAKGETEPAVGTAADVADERNRRVEITWR